MRRRQIYGGKTHPVPLNSYGFIHISVDGGMKQQTIGLIRREVTLALLRAKVGIELVDIYSLQRLVAIAALTEHVGELGVDHQALVRITLDGNKVVSQERLLQSQNERIRDVRQGPDGFLYLLTDNADGRVLKVLP